MLVYLVSGSDCQDHEDEKENHERRLQTELVEILKNMFIPQKKMIKEQIEWLIDHKYLRRDEEDINTFLYVV